MVVVVVVEEREMERREREQRTAGVGRRGGRRRGCGSSETGPQPFSGSEAWGYATGERDSASW